MISVPLHSTTSDYHLGNNREVVDASGTVTQVTNYYPFGAPYADASATLNPSLQAYKYNGKELDRMHGLNGTLSGLAIMEEFFHAYQNDNSANYTGEFNREFEAKTFCIAATGQTADLYQGMQAWSEGIALGKYSGQFEYISPAAASSPKFLEEYQSSANQYASFNKQHNIGNINYHQATTCKPQNLINVINLTYNK